MSEFFFLNEAYKQAEKALAIDEIPVGAVIVKNGKVIARGYNKTNKGVCSINHAEIEAIRKACLKLNLKILCGCDLYVTLEPCPMCLYAALLARINTVYFGAADPKTGACGGKIDIVSEIKFNHRLKIRDLKCLKCSEILKNFFKTKRKN